MSKTAKRRQSPTESATIFPIGTIKKGNDGNKWQIIETKTGIHRWSKITMNIRSKTVKHKRFETVDNKTDISIARITQIGKKNGVSTSGKSKAQIAEILFNIRGNALSTRELQEIHNLLPSKQKKEAQEMIADQVKNPVTDYKGMWRPAPKPLHDMTRREMINSLCEFRDAWEKNMGRNQDLSDERLAGETDKGLRERLKYYYSDTAKQQAANWIREDTR